MTTDWGDGPFAWMAHALCVGHPNPDLFFPSCGGVAAEQQAEEAATVCAQCPVQTPCRAHKRHTDATSGVWGGEYTTTKGKPHPLPARPPGQHGTDSGYRQHIRNGTPPCQPCLIAHNAAVQRKPDKPHTGNHGTDGGYRQHLRRREPPCQACRRAHTRAEQDRAQRRART